METIELFGIYAARAYPRTVVLPGVGGRGGMSWAETRRIVVLWDLVVSDPVAYEVAEKLDSDCVSIGGGGGGGGSGEVFRTLCS